MDWIRLTKSGKDLTGTKGKILKVTRKELAKHNKRGDAWMALNGIVYNVTEYMDYHPGGWDELIRGAGIDATNLFNEIHRWVNYESMLSACVVGKLVTEFLPPAPVKKTKKGASTIMVSPNAGTFKNYQFLNYTDF
jgi:cytochrome-b5 reductase